MTRLKEDERILSLISPIKAEQPAWGYRMVWAYLKYRLGHKVNKKRIYRIMKEHELLVKPNLRLKSKHFAQKARSIRYLIKFCLVSLNEVKLNYKPF